MKLNELKDVKVGWCVIDTTNNQVVGGPVMGRAGIADRKNDRYSIGYGNVDSNGEFVFNKTPKGELNEEIEKPLKAETAAAVKKALKTVLGSEYKIGTFNGPHWRTADEYTYEIWIMNSDGSYVGNKTRPALKRAVYKEALQKVFSMPEAASARVSSLFWSTGGGVETVLHLSIRAKPKAKKD